MIVCSCNVIMLSEIEEVILDFLEEEPWQLITAGMIYHAMQKRGKCCGCFPRVIDVIVQVTTEYHERLSSSQADLEPLVRRIRAEHDRTERIRTQARHLKMVEAA